jgi:hypothetical protein
MNQEHEIVSDISRSASLLLKSIPNQNLVTESLQQCITDTLGNIVYIKQIWYSRESYRFSQMLISDILNAFCALSSTDQRVFYFYLRSSIENFYKSSILADDRTQVAYYQAENNFKQLTATNFNFIWQFKYLKFEYNHFSDLVHFNPTLKCNTTDEFISETLRKNDFSEYEVLSQAAFSMLNLLEVYSDFYQRMPAFEPREDSFYRRKDLRKFMKKLIK